jgi:hypothetical protein
MMVMESKWFTKIIRSALFSYEEPGFGLLNFTKRSKLLNSFINDTLVIEVRMRPLVPEKSSPSPFIPENPSACKIIQGLFMNDKSANIVFEVGGGKRKDNGKKSPRLRPLHSQLIDVLW